MFLCRWADQNRRWLNLLSNGVILFIVYTAFCDSVEGRLWEKYGISLTLEVLGAVVILFTTVSLLVLGVCSLVQLSREDFIAALFCSVKKTLAMGVPLAQLIFGTHANLGFILLPIMFYHPFQLFVCGLLANRFARRSAGRDDSFDAGVKLVPDASQVMREPRRHRDRCEQSANR